MFHKGKRRRRFIPFAQAEPGASSSDGLSELARIAASFEPVRYELDDRQFEASPDRDEPRSLKPAIYEPAARTRTSSSVSPATGSGRSSHSSFPSTITTARITASSKCVVSDAHH